MRVAAGYGARPGNRSTATAGAVDRQPEIDVAGLFHAAGADLVVRFVAVRLVGEHIVHDHVTARKYGGECHRADESSAFVGMLGTACCRGPSHVYPLDRDHDSP